MHLVHQVEWTPAHLVVNSSDVLAQESDADQLDAAQIKNRQHGADIPVSRNDAKVFQVKQRVPDCNQREEECKGQHTSTQHHAEPQRLVTEAEDGIHGVLEQLKERLFRLSRCAVGALVIDESGGKADPGAQSGKITVSLLQVDDRVGGLTVEQTEDPSIQWDRVIRDQAHDFVEKRKEPAADASLSPAGAFRDHYFRTASPCVHQNDAATLGRLQSRRECGLVAEVSRELNNRNARVLALYFQQQSK